MVVEDVSKIHSAAAAELQVGEQFKTYRVRPADREPLIAFMVDALERVGCRIIHRPLPSFAPFRITFETVEGERIGLVTYAFLANSRSIKHRPLDEHRFQIKYGGDLSGLHEIWQDPYGLYVSLLLGINPREGFFVAADPVLRDPTRFSVSVEFKDKHVENILRNGWFAWEREQKGGVPDPERKRTARAIKGQEPLFEALVGGTPETFLRLIRFEREALGEDPGERQYLAEHFSDSELLTASRGLLASQTEISEARLHALAKEFELPESRVLDLIAERRMLKMAVRGSVAEEHLLNQLRSVRGVTQCERLKDEHGPDVALSFGGRRIAVECKNSSRERTADGYEKIDLQRTRASKSDFCSRYYRRTDFDLVAACIHAVTGRWEFKYGCTQELELHKTCKGRLSNNVKLDDRWTADVAAALKKLVAGRPV